MTTDPLGSQSPTRHRIRVAVQFALALALIAYGVGRLTDVIAWSLPPAAYFLAALGLLVYGVVLAKRE